MKNYNDFINDRTELNNRLIQVNESIQRKTKLFGTFLIKADNNSELKEVYEKEMNAATESIKKLKNEQKNILEEFNLLNAEAQKMGVKLEPLTGKREKSELEQILESTPKTEHRASNEEVKKILAEVSGDKTEKSELEQILAETEKTKNETPTSQEQKTKKEKKTIFQRIVNSNWAKNNSIGKRVAAVMISIQMLFTPTALLNSPNKSENEKGEDSKVPEKVVENVELEENVPTQVQKQMSSFLEGVQLTEEQKIQYEENVRKKLEQEKKEVDIHLGEVLQMPKGIDFYETSTGLGKKGTIGENEELSPVNGFYVIDYYSIEEQQGIMVEQGLEGQIPKKEGKTAAHISFVPGATSLAEAKKIISEQNERVKKGMQVDSEKIQPRGWVDMEKIENIMRNQQRQQQSADLGERESI